MTPASEKRFNTVPLSLRILANLLVLFGIILYPISYIPLIITPYSPGQTGYMPFMAEHMGLFIPLGMAWFVVGVLLLLILPRAHNRWPVFYRALAMFIRRNTRAFIAWGSSPQRMLRTLLWLVFYVPPTLSWTFLCIFTMWLPQKREHRWMMYIQERDKRRRRRINQRLTAWGF